MILDPVMVEVQGARKPLNQVAQVFVKDPQMLAVSVHDISVCLFEGN